MSTRAVLQLDSKELLKRHRLHEGLYARVARKLGVDASYVSRVAHGERNSERIFNALVEELRRIENGR
jgi:transcriptional regulator with XRE-family HTH domain